MDNVGGNGANGRYNNLEEQFNNGGFDNIQNIVARELEDPMVGFQAALRDEIGVPDNQLGLDQPPEMNPQQDDILPNNEEFSSPSLYNPQSPQNSPGSESSTNVKPDHMNRASDLLMAVSIGADPNKNKIIEQAVGAMEELIKMATLGEPLWQRIGNVEMETLNGIQYLREFGCFDPTMEEIIRMVETADPQLFPSFDVNDGYVAPDIPVAPFLKPGFEPLHIEGSRDIGFVNMNPMNIVELLMDSKQWPMVFSSIVSRTTLLGVILDSVDGSYNGVLQVMTAEFHQSTPLIPTRQSYFARYCKRVALGTWGVVDVSLENLFPYPQVLFRRRPSGCLIQEIPDNGTSRITWVEHVEVDNKYLHHLFRPIVSSGFAFGAKRWIAAINRHCQWLAASMARTTPTDAGVLIPQPGRESLLKLAERMTRNFFLNFSSCTENLWMGLPLNFGAEDVRFRFGNTLVVPGKPPNKTLIFTTSVRFPVPVKFLFDFLRHEHSRNKWDMLSNGRLVRELAYVITGEDPRNRVSVMQVNSSPNTVEILYLQESYSDETGSYIVYSPVDAFTMSVILNGGNPNAAAILSSGFAILPDKPPEQGNEPVGSILTMSFQCADCQSTDEFIPPVTLKTIDIILATTVASIRNAIMDNRHGMQSGGK
ncbi:protodermal factor 2 [Hibiscus trionum]|uniref:Protodermal factor 2 n=1 Tax=Hibiscus trionum TaxID=183268 RepID=A0A9W7J8L9_HIBTR|nr:protodermal factor 2 [Hibiscus trionum]